jgi:hypothetical protein
VKLKACLWQEKAGLNSASSDIDPVIFFDFATKNPPLREVTEIEAGNSHVSDQSGQHRLGWCALRREIGLFVQSELYGDA